MSCQRRNPLASVISQRIKRLSASGRKPSIVIAVMMRTVAMSFHFSVTLQKKKRDVHALRQRFWQNRKENTQHHAMRYAQHKYYAMILLKHQLPDFCLRLLRTYVCKGRHIGTRLPVFFYFTPQSYKKVARRAVCQGINVTLYRICSSCGIMS